MTPVEPWVAFVATAVGLSGLIGLAGLSGLLAWWLVAVKLTRSES